MTTQTMKVGTVDGAVIPSFRNSQGLNFVQAGVAEPLVLLLSNDTDIAAILAAALAGPPAKAAATITVDFSKIGGTVTLTQSAVACHGFSVSSWTNGVLTLTVPVGRLIWHRDAPLAIHLGTVTASGSVGLATVTVTLANIAAGFDQTVTAGLVILAAPQTGNATTPLVAWADSNVLNGALSRNPAPPQALRVAVTVPVPEANAPATSLPAPQVLVTTVQQAGMGLRPLLGIKRMTATVGATAATVQYPNGAPIWQLALPAGTGAPANGQPSPFTVALAGIAPEQMGGTSTLVVYTLGFSGCDDACTVLDAQIETLSVSIGSFTATPSSFVAGTGAMTTSLTWSVQNAAMVTLSCAGVVSADGTTGTPVTVEDTSTFVLTAWGSGFATMAAQAVTVTVTPGLQARLVPSGVIMAWSGTVASIPSGWTFCDGSSGAPDLRDRFILGAGGSEAPGQSGAADTHTHTLSALNPQTPFSFTSSSVADHAHGMPTSWYAQNLSCGKWASLDTGGNMGSGTTTQSAGGHDHTVGVSFGAIATDSSVAGRPPWYALCYVMKL